ncbi:MAG: hypothetical protein HFI46_09770 [Lachnospiraceae bacterium]|jgi:TM2 domain-containing membrane protein YozV|nr:hypothetical protein [Lachnospiraceae bacterium]
MDYNNGQTPVYHQAGVTMAAASLFLGLGAVFTVLTVFLPLVFGGLAILFALLSKGYGRKMLSQARIGFGCGIASLCTVAVLFVSTFISMVSNPDQLIQIGQQYDAICENVYGQSSEDLLGYSFEERMREYAELFQ